MKVVGGWKLPGGRGQRALGDMYIRAGEGGR